jgi:demethylmenaquinone methyltransferase/2-methoxy-6-polyprenyl-1,4-benzoquinol methylase
MTPPAFFDKIAKHYDLMTHFYMLGTYYPVRRKILKMHREGSNEVLDICCGTGYISNQISAKRVVGIDLSMPMLRMNQQNQARGNGRAHLINGTIRTLPFEDKRFDEVYFTLAAHEFPDLADILVEIARVMRPGGRLVIYDLYEPRNPLLKLILYTFYYYVVEQKWMHVYTREGWQEILEQNGFRNDQIVSPLGFSALVSAVK